MKKNIFYLLITMFLIITIGIGGCTYLGNENNNNYIGKSQFQDERMLDRKKFKSFYIEGNFNEELYKIQKSLDEDEVYINIIESKKEFDNEVEKYNLDTPRMEYSLNYDKEYFKDKAILLVYPSQDSSSISYTVKEVKEYNNRVYVLIEEYIPNEIKPDMINHGLLIEIHGKSSDNLVDVKIEKAYPPREE